MSYWNENSDIKISDLCSINFNALNLLFELISLEKNGLRIQAVKQIKGAEKTVLYI